MAGLIGALSNGAHALAAASQGVQIAGKNIANSAVQGYARQKILLSTPGSVDTPLGIQSMALRATGLEQLRDRFLDQQVVREVSNTNYLQAKSENLNKAQIQFGEEIDASAGSNSITDTKFVSSGIGAAITGFFNAFEEFATRPNDVGTRQLLMQKSDLLTERINLASQRLSDLQQSITSEITTGAESVNGLLNQIATLNREIEKVEINRPNGAVDLRDQRQVKLEQLAKYMDFTAREIPDSNGQVEITSGNEVVLLTRGVVRGTLSFDGTLFTGGSPAAELELQGGQLAGSLAVRDGDISQMRSDLEAMAKQLSASVNNAYNPGGSGSDFFTITSSGLIQRASGITASTVRSSTSSAPLANELALAVADVVGQQHSSSAGDFIDGTLNAFYNRTVGRLGQSLSIASSSLEDQQTVQRLITSQRDEVSAVSQDEELTELMKYQRSFQATSRVITVIDDLLDVLINRTLR